MYVAFTLVFAFIFPLRFLWVSAHNRALYRVLGWGMKDLEVQITKQREISLRKENLRSGKTVRRNNRTMSILHLQMKSVRNLRSRLAVKMQADHVLKHA